MSGFIKIYRSIFKHDIWKSELDFRLFLLILGQAVWKDEYKYHEGIELKRGQWIRSIRKLQEDLEYKDGRTFKQYGKHTIQRAINRLIENGMITTTVTEYGTLFTVVNYAKYQDLESADKEYRDTYWDSSGTLSGQYRDNKKKDKKDKKDKNNNTLCSKFKFETHHMKLAELLFKKMRENNPKVKKPNLESWANTFRLMMERDKREGKEIQDLILWSQQHHFWYKNILSAEKLRKQYDRLLLEMKDSKPNNQFKVINGGKSDEISQSSYREDYSRYDFTKGNEL